MNALACQRVIAALSMAFLLYGCSHKKGKEETKKAPQKDAPPTFQGDVNTTPGTAEVYGHEGKSTKRVQLWTVSWQKLDAKLTQTGLKTGRMVGVHAMLKSGSAKGTTISADHGLGDEKTKILTLTDNVVVLSADRKTRLNCDSMKYDSQRQLIYADGNVKLKNPVGTVGTFSHLISTADFRKVATPGDFAQP